MFALYFFEINGAIFCDAIDAAVAATKIARRMGYKSTPELISLGDGNYEVIFYNEEGYSIRAYIEFN